MKKFFICLGVLLFCGCSAKVNLTVQPTHEGNLSLEVTGSKRFMNQYYQKASDIAVYYRDYLDQNGIFSDTYDLDVSYNGNAVTGKLNSQILFDSGTPMEKFFFREVTNEDNHYTFVFSDAITLLFGQVDGMKIDPEGILEEIKIEIRFMNQVEFSNATEVNTRKNIYTWVITKENLGEKIEFSLSKKKRYDIIVAYFLEKKFIIILLSVIFLVILIGGFILGYRIKHENEI